MMKDKKTNPLINELAEIRQRIIELETLESGKKELVIEQHEAKNKVNTSNLELEDSNLQYEQIIERTNNMIISAEIANYTKKTFLANMSHKIRTTPRALWLPGGLLP